MKTISLAPLLLAFSFHACTGTDRGAAPAASATAPLAAAQPPECGSHECGEGDAPAAADAPVKVAIEGLPTFGAKDALVTVVTFVDYECPYSAKMHATLAELRKQYGDDLRIAVAVNPLPFHDRAVPAARTFLAAAALGRGEEIESRLYASPKDDASLHETARASGVDVDSAASNRSADAMFERARALGKELGVTATPTVFVDGRRIVGAQLETTKTAVAERMAFAKSELGRGVPRGELYAHAMAAAEVAKPVAQVERDLTPVAVSLDGAPLRGPKDAPVTVVVFSDYECPFCARLDRTLHELDAQFPGKIRFAMRQKPLPMHPSARLAARAAIAADAQGKFWAVHDVLVQHRDALDRASLVRYAGEAGLDGVRFVHDLDTPETEARLVADEAQSASLHVTGTPTVFVSGRRVEGAQTLDTFRRVVTSALP